MKIGFIGMGIMGSRMAANLLKNEYELSVNIRTKDKARSLLEMGARWAETPAKLGQKVDVLITMLADPEAVYEVTLGKDGFLEALKPGSIWIDCSTVNPSFSEKMASEAAGRNIRFLDAPVMGSRGPAEGGVLVFLVGGVEAVVEACQPYFTAMGRKVIHVGNWGKGSAMKMVFNMLLGVAMQSFSEAMALGRSLGIEPDKLIENLIDSPVTAPFLAGKKEKIEKHQFSADFPLKWMFKDLHLVGLSAFEGGVALPLAGVTKELFALARSNGWGAEDFSAVYKLLNR